MAAQPRAVCCVTARVPLPTVSTLERLVGEVVTAAEHGLTPCRVAPGCECIAMKVGRRSPWRTALVLIVLFGVLAAPAAWIISLYIGRTIFDCCPQIEPVGAVPMQETTGDGLIIGALAGLAALIVSMVRRISRQRTDPRIYGYDDQNDHADRPRWSGSLTAAGVAAVTFGVLWMNIAAIANVRLDGSVATTVRAAVVDKVADHGKSPEFYLVVHAWRGDDANALVRIPVRKSTFDAVPIGGVLTLNSHAGFLGYTWVQRP